MNTFSMVRASIVHVSSQSQRQTLRRQLGTLNLNLVKRITVARYAEHFNRFSQHLSDTIKSWPTSPEEFDLVTSEYLEILWDLGEPKTAATYTLASIHYYLPQLKRKLPRSRQLKAVWDKLELPCQAVPLDLDTLFSIVSYFWFSDQAPIAMACLIAFNAMLRTGELLELRVGDCSPAPDCWVLQLRSTKAGQRRLLQDESVIIKDSLTIAALTFLTRNKNPGDFLVGVSPHRFRKAWNVMKMHFEISHLKYLPYSLRRGGATWYFNHTGNFSRTMLRGRWQHLKTCKLYIAEAQMTLATLALPTRTQKLFAKALASLRPHLHQWAKTGRVEGG